MSISPAAGPSGIEPSPPATTTDSAPARATIPKGLGDDALIARVDSLTRLERCNTLEILLHLMEVDHRKLWRPLEYRSMFDYCVRRLRYSEAAASRRIRTARLIARYPYVYGRIRSGRLTLCAVAKIARAVLEDGRGELIDRIEGKRLDQVDAILATRRNPSRPVRESIRMLCVERPVAGPAPAPPQLGAPAGALEAPAASEGPAGVTGTAAGSTRAEASPGSDPAPGTRGNGSNGDGSAPGSGVHDQNGGRELTRVDRVFRLQFGIEADAMTKFSRVQSIAARRAGHHVDLSELFGVLCQVYLERYDATTRAKRQDRRRARKEKRGKTDTATSRSQPDTATRSRQPVPGGQGEHSSSATGSESAGRTGRGPAGAPAGRDRTAHIPESVRSAVVRRDGGRCTFVDRNGERCTETIALQIDHVRPRALGGSDDPTNLRAMCAAHNRLLAERTFGRKTVERAIRSARPDP